MAMLLTKAERSEKAREDLGLYVKMLRGGNTDGCLLIEQDWDLDGLPPDLVTAVLQAVGEGKTLSKVMSELGL